jgi:glycosyltransferase involved in cell wall biosynthesis
MAVLLGRMLENTDFKFACAAFGDTRELQASHDDRIDCFVIPKGWSDTSAAFGAGLRACRDLVNEWKPDLIHIHGTEGAYGLLTAHCLVKGPAVISLQGLLGPYAEWYQYFGNRSLMDIFRMHRWLEIPALRGQCMEFMHFRKKAKREREIITGNRFFMGRTEWDRAYLSAHNPSAHYYHGGELLREAYWEAQWNIARVKRHQIIFTNAGHPRKGAELLLDAVKLLQPNYPDIQVGIAGSISHRSGYGRYIRRRISEMGHAAIELGPLNSEEMVEVLVASHVFVSPSFIDNSPNAVCEAQLLGMPVISTYTGGVPSLIEDGRTGLFFPTGDAPMLASKLRDVFENDELSVQLGNQARSVALQRHDPILVVSEILNAYEDVMRNAT